MNPVDLEQLTDRRLRQLRQPRAPRTLLPRVMAAVHLLAERPWYARTWFTWPLAGQMLSAGVVVSVVLGLLWASPVIETSFADATSRVTSQLLSPFAGAIAWAERISFAARVVWQSALQTVVIVLSVLVLLMFAACAALGAALERVALGGVSRS